MKIQKYSKQNNKIVKKIVKKIVNNKQNSKQKINKIKKIIFYTIYK